MKKKAIALISGGLDSLLAARVLMEQGIEVQGVCFVMSFSSKNLEEFKSNVEKASWEAKIPIKIIDISEDFLEILKAPKYGYGANINPCIDCKICMLKKAKNLMKKFKASFVVTGEVLGERPMSQNKGSLSLIKRESGLEGLILRPLSAKALEETIPEKEGLVERDKLLNIKGRSRKPQYRLAKKYNIKKFFAPAGGCLLTAPAFSDRIKDLIEHNDLTIDNVDLIKYGRFFRLPDGSKTVIGRDEQDNNSLLKLKKKKDIIVRLKTEAGPYAILRGKGNQENIQKTAELVVSHSKYRDDKMVEAEYWEKEAFRKTIEVSSLNNKEIDALRV